jgi:hypothetical protein
VEEKPKEMLNRDKSPGVIDRTSKEAGWASEKARKGRGRRRQWISLPPPQQPRVADEMSSEERGQSAFQRKVSWKRLRCYHNNVSVYTKLEKAQLALHS